jgi:multiple sugar transport system ATP-binding protein
MQQSIDFIGVKKSYDGKNYILKDINLHVDPGQFLILVGPSGCGKSTLLNCLAGLDEVTEGEIRIGSRVVNDVQPKDRDIAMVFQSYALYPNMNVRENMAFGLKIRNVPEAEQTATINRVAQMLQLDHLLDRTPGQLSGGQRQRVAMGRALARNPGLFLFDEPLSNLDAKLRVEMRAEIKQLHQRTGITSVYVTHDQIEAMTLGDRIAVMKDGIVQQYGSPMEIYQKPANLFVASFIGSPGMNLIPIDVAAGSQGVSFGLNSEGHKATVQSPYAELAAYQGKKVTLGLRPEDLSIGVANGLKVKTMMIERTGPEVYVFFEINGKRCCAVSTPDLAPATGEVIEVGISPSAKINYFNSESGKRI